MTKQPNPPGRRATNAALRGKVVFLSGFSARKRPDLPLRKGKTYVKPKQRFPLAIRLMAYYAGIQAWQQRQKELGEQP